MKKQLFMTIVAGLTLLGTARSASATGTVTTTTNVQIDGTNVSVPTNQNTTTVNGATVPPTTTVTPSTTAPTTPANSIIPPGLGTTVGTTVQGTVNNTVTTAGTGAIQSGNTTLTTAATQQTAGISAALNKIPFVGGMANGLMQQKIAAGIGDLSKMATVKFTEMMNDPNNPLGGIGQTIAGWFGGGNPAQTAQDAQQKAQDKTVADYQQGATDATNQMSKATKDQLEATERLLQANAGQTGDVGTTTAYVSGAKQVADLAMNANPASGNLTDKSAVDVKATQAIAESANGVAGQAALNSRVVNTAVNVAGMQSDASKTVDNSLDQLNIISGQLAKQGNINGEAVRIAAEQRTIAAAQLAQNGSDADARVRKEREEQRQKDYLLVNRTYNRGIVAGLTGAVKPSPVKLP
jgi:hypothetical protein